MLGKLFGSNTRVKILKLFLLNPDGSFYLRQISRDLKLQLNSVRRELENLETFGLLTTKISEPQEEQAEYPNLLLHKKVKKSRAKIIGEKQEGKEKKYYQANRNFILFEEIKALIVKAQILYEREFIEKLEKAGKTKLLILSGFFVNNAISPVDMLIVGRYNKSKISKLIKELETELNKEINYTIMDSKEYKYRRDITDVFLYGILEGRKLIVIDEFGIS